MKTGSQAGYTLIELLIITIVIGVLASIAMFTFFDAPDRAHTAALKFDLRSLVSAQEIYYSEHQTYAGNVETLGSHYSTSRGVSVTLTAEGESWSAEATHPAIPIKCHLSAGREQISALECG